MNRIWYGASVLAMVALLVLSACAPAAAPAPAPAPLAPAPKALSAEEAAWVGVVEAAKKEGKVTAYSFTMITDLAVAMFRGFKEEYGIDLEIVSGTGAVLLERIKAERRAGKNIADYYDTSTGLITMAHEDGFLAPLGELPALKEKEAWAASPVLIPGYAMYAYPSLTAPIINTKLVPKGEEPRSYYDLLDPRWKGKIVVLDPNSVPTANRLYVIMLREKALTHDYFKSLRQQDLKFAITVREGPAMLARGEATVGLAESVSTAITQIKEGAPIKPIFLKEGILGTGPGMTVLKDAPHPNATRLFINWRLSQRGQAAQAKAMDWRSQRRDVTDFTPAAAKLEGEPIFMETLEDLKEVSRIQRERFLYKLWRE